MNLTTNVELTPVLGLTESRGCDGLFHLVRIWGRVETGMQEELRIVQEITSWNEVAGAESAKPRLTMNSNQPWRRRLRHSHPPFFLRSSRRSVMATLELRKLFRESC